MLIQSLVVAAPTWAAPPPPPAPEVTLPAALRLMPDTPTTRSVGVWYADYALAERVYGTSGIVSMTDPRIIRFFQAMVGLRPGPETGVAALTGGRWRQVYGYDLFQIGTEAEQAGLGRHELLLELLEPAGVGEIARTHHAVQYNNQIVVVELQLERAAERANVFPELDRLNAQFAPAIEEVKFLRAKLKEIASQINKINGMLA